MEAIAMKPRENVDMREEKQFEKVIIVSIKRAFAICIYIILNEYRVLESISYFNIILKK